LPSHAPISLPFGNRVQADLPLRSIGLFGLSTRFFADVRNDRPSRARVVAASAMAWPTSSIIIAPIIPALDASSLGCTARRQQQQHLDRGWRRAAIDRRRRRATATTAATAATATCVGQPRDDDDAGVSVGPPRGR
jgi:hypothetical protein